MRVQTHTSLHSTSFAWSSEVISVTTFNVIHKVHNSVTSVHFKGEAVLTRHVHKVHNSVTSMHFKGEAVLTGHVHKVHNSETSVQL